MMFDDYNYDQFNQYILHDDPTSLIQPVDDTQQYYLTLSYLNEMHKENYAHDQLDVLSEKEKKYAEIEK